MIYALDTNIISYFIKNDATIVARMRLENSKGNQFVIPPTVCFEINNWLLRNNSKIKWRHLRKCI
jgi:rRNA-processing protein FCF1